MISQNVKKVKKIISFSETAQPIIINIKYTDGVECRQFAVQRCATLRSTLPLRWSVVSTKYYFNNWKGVKQNKNFHEKTTRTQRRMISEWTIWIRVFNVQSTVDKVPVYANTRHPFTGPRKLLQESGPGPCLHNIIVFENYHQLSVEVKRKKK